MLHHRSKGSSLIYATLVTFAMAGMVALAVDWGRMQVTKTELRGAADAAARYAVAGLQNDLDGLSAAYANATESVKNNRANGRPITFVPSSDVEIGVWSTSARTFTPSTDLNLANAVRVTLRCASSRGSAVPMTFLSVLGRPSCDVSAVSVAMIDYTGNVGGAGNGRYEYFIPATCNPWLAGMKSGSIASVNNPHSNPDYAGTALTDAGQTKSYSSGRGYTTGGSTTAGSAEDNYAAWGDYAAKKASPVQAGGISIGNSTITFDGVNGGATNAAGQTPVNADGSGFVTNSAGAENGIANINAPINSIIGVFLDDTKPNKTDAPDALDFSSSGIGTDFKVLSPQLKQPFFIGDGRTSTGEVQQFIPPSGATRLYVCTMDSYEWSNNVGGFYVTAHAKGHIVTVK